MGNNKSEIFWCKNSKNENLALIVRGSYFPSGVEFVTPPELSQQLALMYRPTGDTIDSHTHLPVGRNVTGTQEVIIMRSGKLRLDLYEEDQRYISSVLLEQGDIALLVAGGHGFSVIEEAFFLEVKQGPFSPEADKTRFPETHSDQIVWTVE